MKENQVYFHSPTQYIYANAKVNFQNIDIWKTMRYKINKTGRRFNKIL